jgi:phosphatidylinositol alpha-mannosyltransferase
VRVALVCPYSWDVPGGVQVQVGELARRLAARGHEVLVLAPGGSAAGERFVRIVARPVAIPYQGTVAPIAPWPWSARRIDQELRRFRPDVLHAHEPLTPSTSMYAVLRSRAPVVATFHAYAARSRLFDRAAPLVRPVWRRLSVRLAVSEAAAGFVTTRMGGDVRVVPNGVDVDRFASAEPVAGLPPGRHLLWVGRLDRQKGFPVAVRAFGLLSEEQPDLSLVVVGEGRDRGAVGLLPAAARGRVVMVGAVTHDRLPAYHAAADVSLSPALGQESFGLVLVEAMAAGVPVVASDIAGYREVIRHGTDGLLVAPNDPGALAGAVRRILSDPSLATSLREGGRRRAKRYGWEAVLPQIEDAYAEALATPGRSRSR